MIADLATLAQPSRLWRAVIPVGAGIALLLLPPPPGLAPFAWHYLALFVAVILALITEPLPSPAIGLIGVTAAGVSGLPFSPAQLADPAFRLPSEALRWTVGGFVNSTVWLIFGAFIFATGYEKTGLGRRIALLLVKHLGGRTLGLGYAVAIADLVVAPFIPSNAARSGGVIYPVVRAIPELYGSLPGATARRIGSYVLWVAFATTCVTSSMFVTALAPNLFALELVTKTTGVEVSWSQWFLGFVPVGGPLLLLLPLLVYRIYPPEIRTSHEVPIWAAGQLRALGRITRNEVIMSVLVASALVLWIGGGRVIDPALVALVGVSMMLLFGIVAWEDIAANSTAWNVLVWFATLVVLADGLAKVGVIDWIGRTVSTFLAGRSPMLVMTLFVVLFFVLHYVFASLTAHATALMPVMLAAGASVPGMPLRTFAMLMCFSLGLMGVLTPYATGPAPVYFGSGYIPRRDFWRLGLIFGLIFLGALLLVGLPGLLIMNQ